MTTTWRFTALADRHRALGSKLEDWSGMQTAWTYDKDIYAEHVAIRTKAGLMDVSGLKKVHLVGPHALAVLDYVTTRDVSKIYPGKSVYAAMLNERGQFTDDCIIYRTGPNSWMLVHGSGTGHEEIVKQAAGRNCAVLFDDDLHDLSLQGPLAVDFLAKYVPGIRDLKYFHHIQTTLFGVPVMISRTGYTGERGYELVVPAADAGSVWDAVVAAGQQYGIAPAGLGARDTLRTEMGYPLHGQDLQPDLSAAQCGVGWAIGWKKESFWGDAALRAEREAGPERRLTGLVARGRGIPRPHMEVVHDDAVVGEVTSGTFSPTLGKGIALALLPPALVPGTAVTVRVRNREEPFDVAKPPFVTPGVREA